MKLIYSHPIIAKQMEKKTENEVDSVNYLSSFLNQIKTKTEENNSIKWCSNYFFFLIHWINININFYLTQLIKNLIKSFLYVCHVFIYRLHPIPSVLLIGFICSLLQMIDSLVLLFFFLLFICAYLWIDQFNSYICILDFTLRLTVIFSFFKTKRNRIGTHWHTVYFLFV
jgi:hypothetical protein